MSPIYTATKTFKIIIVNKCVTDTITNIASIPNTLF